MNRNWTVSRRISLSATAAALDTLPRMADYARVLASLDQKTGWGCLEAFLSVEARAFEEVVEGDEVATALRRYLETRVEPLWEGTATELLGLLTPDRPDKYWPRTPRHLSGRIRRAATALRAVDIEATFPERAADKRTIQIQRVGESVVRDVRTVTE